MISTFHFMRPGALWLFLPALGFLWFIRKRGRADRTWGRIMDPHLLGALAVVPDTARRAGPLLGYTALLSLGIVALAGPAWKQIPSPFAEDQAPLAIAIKVTPSMQQRDLPPSRLERAIHKVRDILSQRPGARTALLAYAGSAHLVMPLTRDAAVIETFAASLQPDIMPAEGDRPSLALEQAARSLGDAGAGGSVLFITDGMTADETKRMTELGLGVHIVLLGACSAEDAAPERRELQEAARILDAPLVFISPDDQDVKAVLSSIQRRFESSAGGEEGRQWRDDGYWLLPFVAGIALLWFRQGWLMAEVHE
jgi:Ca-activated chloride channel family protein